MDKLEEIRKLVSIKPPMTCEEEMDCLEDGFASNIDDAYAAGVEQGEALLAASILEILNKE